MGANFISWIKLLYSSPTAQIQTNKDKSIYFHIIMVLGWAFPYPPFFLQLRSGANYKVVHRAGVENKVSLYADDFLLYIYDANQLLGMN